MRPFSVYTTLWPSVEYDWTVVDDRRVHDGDLTAMFGVYHILPEPSRNPAPREPPIPIDTDRRGVFARDGRLLETYVPSTLGPKNSSDPVVPMPRGPEGGGGPDGDGDGGGGAAVLPQVARSAHCAALSAAVSEQQ